MSRKQLPLPTHSGLAFNKLRDYLAYAFIFMSLVVFITLWTITYSIRRDCQRPYDRHFRILGYWAEVRIGSGKDECREP